MIRIHSEGFILNVGLLGLTVIGRPYRSHDWPCNGGRVLREPAAIVTLRTPGGWQLLSNLGGGRSP